MDLLPIKIKKQKMSNANVSLVKLKNIQDKEIYYVRISNNGKTATINVGEKTFKNVEDTLDNKQVQLEIPVEKEVKKEKIK